MQTYSDFLPNYIKDLIVKHKFVGSRYVCNPPPMDTDLDILCLYEYSKYPLLADELQANNWEYQSNGYLHPSKFTSYKKDVDGTPVNLIITGKPDWYSLFAQATEQCKEQNLLDKKDRIALFNKVMGVEEKKNPKGSVTKQYDEYCDKIWAEMAQKQVNVSPASFGLMGYTKTIHDSYYSTATPLDSF